MTVLRLHTSSTGLDTGRMLPGSDLVLHLHPAHGADVPSGAYVLDHLDPAARRGADLAALDTLADWRERFDERLTVEGICWPFIWQLPLYRVLNGAVARALGLRRALEASGARVIELADAGEETARLASAVAEHLGLEVRLAPGAPPPGPLGPPRPAPGRVQLARRRAIEAVTRRGAPTVLRRGSVGIHAYWPLMPLLDRMLEEPGRRPALVLDKRPSGVRRSLRMAWQGGWVGAPTAADRRWGRERAASLIDAAAGDDRLEADGLQLGPWLHPQVLGVVRRRAGEDLANARMLRRALAGRRLRWMVGAYDVDPDARLIVVLAREAGVRTLMLCHGCYVLPQPFGDLDVCDEVALWSYDVAPDITNWDRPIHLVGYPLPHDPPPPTRRAPADRPLRISVMGQGTVPSTCVLDDRITMASYVTALEAIGRHFPEAEVVLRPNPRQDDSAFRALRQRFPGLVITEHRGGDIGDVHRSTDLAIGGASTATFQASLFGTPVILLNLTGTEWPHPLGGPVTAVPIARTAQELDAALATWRRDRTLPGREDLLRALGVGVTGRDPVDHLLDILDGRAVPAPQPQRRAPAAEARLSPP